MDLRAYAKAKEIYDSTPMNKRPKNAMMDLVSEFSLGEDKKKLIKEAIQQELAEQERIPL